MSQKITNQFKLSTSIPSLQKNQKIRLQRLIHQRKRMDHMAELIQNQKSNIQILKAQNQTIKNQNSHLSLTSQLLIDKLTAKSIHYQQLSQLMAKQYHLIQQFQCLLKGRNQNITEIEINKYIQQIQACVSMCKIFQNQEKLLRNEGNYSLLKVNQEALYKHKISELTSENQQLNLKYEELCKNFFQVTKENKMIQFELMKFISASKENSPRHLRSNSQLKQQHKYRQLILSKDKEIIQLRTKIEQLSHIIYQKDLLIKEHRKNEIQQKKLLQFLKDKYSLEAKRISFEAKHLSTIQNYSSLIEKIKTSKQKEQKILDMNKTAVIRKKKYQDFPVKYQEGRQQNRSKSSNSSLYS